MGISKTLLFIVFWIVFCESVAGFSESYYVKKHCKGEFEVRLSDGGRVDCITEKKAIEFDFAYKWAECVGQALYYSYMKKLQAVCVLISGKNDRKFKKQVKNIIKYHNLKIKIVIIEKED